MCDIIRVKNASYGRYEELLMRRDAIKKEAFLYEREYIRTFGDLILQVFQIQLECIRKKKTIAFCQVAVNHGKSVDQKELEAYLQKELSAFKGRLDDMIRDTENAKGDIEITEAELLQIKKLYHKLVKKIHPDINPLTIQSEKLMELWQRVVLAYNCNNLAMLQETEILIMKALDQNGNAVIDIEISDIDEKIAGLEAEITAICETDPYQYKFLLLNPEAVKEKEESLNKAKKSYEEYDSQLEEILQSLFMNGMGMTWRMN